ncbi:hypothetical protein BDF22DRAFT_733500 [Syncephalis plumigaleata]|nr:hypothetical protein BDF22DRAFT_733500 [Syncephalis plumigaleata]
MQHLHLPNLSDNDLRREVQNAEHNINKTIGRIPNYIRPPYGELNANNTRVLNDMGYIIVNWNLDSNAVDNSSFITLQHDIHLFSVKLVPEIIKRIKAKGFKFTTVADCIGMPKPLYHDASITGANINNDGDGEPFHDPKFVPNTNASDMSDDMTDDSGLGEDEYSEHQSSSNAYANGRTIGMHRYLLMPILLLVACFSL